MSRAPFHVALSDSTSEDQRMGRGRAPPDVCQEGEDGTPLLNRALGCPGSALHPLLGGTGRCCPFERALRSAAKSQGANANPLAHPEPPALSPCQPHPKICPRRWHICAW